MMMTKTMMTETVAMTNPEKGRSPTVLNIKKKSSNAWWRKWTSNSTKRKMMVSKSLMDLPCLLLTVNLPMTDLSITLWANLVTASSTSATLASMSSSTNVDDPIELVQMVAKKYEDHQDQRVATVLRNGDHYPPRREMSSFVVENSKKKLRSSRRSSWRRRKRRKPKLRLLRRRSPKLVHTKIYQKMKDERRRKRIIKTRRRAQAKMAARTLLSVWGCSEESGNVYLRPTIRWRCWTTKEVTTHGNVHQQPMEQVVSSTSRSTTMPLLRRPARRARTSQVMMTVKNSWMNGMSGPSMKLEKDQELTGKMFTIIWLQHWEDHGTC